MTPVLTPTTAGLGQREARCRWTGLAWPDPPSHPGGSMTTLVNRPNTALVVIDVQNGVVDKAYDRDTVVANINALVDKARTADIPVVWVQHSSDELPRDSDRWQYVPELV